MSIRRKGSGIMSIGVTSHSPGPACVALPGYIGTKTKNQDSKKPRAPAFTFGHRTPIHDRTKVGPGPAAYNTRGKVCGRDFLKNKNQKESIKSRHRRLRSELQSQLNPLGGDLGRSPGPACLALPGFIGNNMKNHDSKKPRAPAFSFGLAAHNTRCYIAKGNAKSGAKPGLRKRSKSRRATLKSRTNHGKYKLKKVRGVKPGLRKRPKSRRATPNTLSSKHGKYKLKLVRGAKPGLRKRPKSRQATPNTLSPNHRKYELRKVRGAKPGLRKLPKSRQATLNSLRPNHGKYELNKVKTEKPFDLPHYFEQTPSNKGIMLNADDELKILMIVDDILQLSDIDD